MGVVMLIRGSIVIELWMGVHCVIEKLKPMIFEHIIQIMIFYFVVPECISLTSVLKSLMETSK